MQFRNPSNNYVESSGSAFTWLWCLLFGPLYFLVKGNIFHAILSFVLALFTLGISHLLYPFFVYGINRRRYLRDGWVPVNGS